MTTANILSMQGGVKGSIEMPAMFNGEVRADLIRRAVIAENSRTLQPKGHYLLAGMQTTARYYGAMNSYRSGRHMGVAIRPRQKLAGGRQGQVRVIPSSVKGKRAHPHMIEKILVERINRKEYLKAIMSAIAATADKNHVQSKHYVEITAFPLVVTNEIESIKRTKDVLNLLNTLKLNNDLDKSHRRNLRKGQRRLSKRRIFRKSALIVVNEDKGIIHAAQNIPGVDVCTVEKLTAGLLAPGGMPGRVTVWSEDAIKNLSVKIEEINLE